MRQLENGGVGNIRGWTNLTSLHRAKASGRSLWCVRTRQLLLVIERVVKTVEECELLRSDMICLYYLAARSQRHVVAQ